MIASLIPGAETKIDLLEASVDGWIEPAIKLRSSVGENETETGAIITDHVVPLPTTIKVTGIVDSVRSNAARANEAWQEVEDLHRESKILKFTSERGVIDECVITGASTTQRTRGLEFMLELQQIVRVDLGSPSTLAPAAEDPTSPGYGRQPIVKTGSKEPVPLPPRTPVYIDSQGRTRVGLISDPQPNDEFVILKDGRYTLSKKPVGEGG